MVSVVRDAAWLHSGRFWNGLESRAQSWIERNVSRSSKRFDPERLNHTTLTPKPDSLHNPIPKPYDPFNFTRVFVCFCCGCFFAVGAPGGGQRVSE